MNQNNKNAVSCPQEKSTPGRILEHNYLQVISCLHGKCFVDWNHNFLQFQLFLFYYVILCSICMFFIPDESIDDEHDEAYAHDAAAGPDVVSSRRHTATLVPPAQPLSTARSRPRRPPALLHPRPTAAAAGPTTTPAQLHRQQTSSPRRHARYSTTPPIAYRGGAAAGVNQAESRRTNHRRMENVWNAENSRAGRVTDPPGGDLRGVEAATVRPRQIKPGRSWLASSGTVPRWSPGLTLTVHAVFCTIGVNLS